MTFQNRVASWLHACFSARVCEDKQERNHRFIEESLELAQSLGCTKESALQLVNYVFSRPAGEPNQEMGGVMVTLAALSSVQEMDMAEAGETELARVWIRIDQIRQKQANKPKGIALPTEEAAR